MLDVRQCSANHYGLSGGVHRLISGSLMQCKSIWIMTSGACFLVSDSLMQYKLWVWCVERRMLVALSCSTNQYEPWVVGVCQMHIPCKINLACRRIQTFSTECSTAWATSCPQYKPIWGMSGGACLLVNDSLMQYKPIWGMSGGACFLVSGSLTRYKATWTITCWC